MVWVVFGWWGFLGVLLIWSLMVAGRGLVVLRLVCLSSGRRKIGVGLFVGWVVAMVSGVHRSKL